MKGLSNFYHANVACLNIPLKKKGKRIRQTPELMQVLVTLVKSLRLVWNPNDGKCIQSFSRSERSRRRIIDFCHPCNRLLLVSTEIERLKEALKEKEKEKEEREEKEKTKEQKRPEPKGKKQSKRPIVSAGRGADSEGLALTGGPREHLNIIVNLWGWPKITSIIGPTSSSL